MSLLPRSSVVPLDPDAVPSFVFQGRDQFLIRLAMATLILYDWVCTLDRETRFFWRGKWTLTRVIFFLNRYAGIVAAVIALPFGIWNTPVETCRSSVWVQNVASTVIITSVDYILTIRVLALFNNNKKLAVALYVLFIVESIAKFVFMIIGSLGLDFFLARLADDITACGESSSAPDFVFILDWSIPLAYGCFLMCLALYKAKKFWQFKGFHGSKLVEVLIRDQAIYFILVIESAVFNLLLDRESAFKLQVTGLLEGLSSLTLQSILGSHMFFNLKEALERGVNEGTNWSSYDIRSIRFNSPDEALESTKSHDQMESVEAMTLAGPSTFSGPSTSSGTTTGSSKAKIPDSIKVSEGSKAKV